MDFNVKLEGSQLSFECDIKELLPCDCGPSDISLPEIKAQILSDPDAFGKIEITLFRLDRSGQ